LSATLPKSSKFAPPLVTETVMTANSPVPLRVSVCGEAASVPLVLVYVSVMTIEVVSLLTVEVGVNVMPMKQLPPPGTVIADDAGATGHELSGVNLKSVFVGAAMG